MKVTLIGTLPPIKGISPYCQGLLDALSESVDVEFIGFKEIYPDFLYPGGVKAGNKESRGFKTKRAKIRNILTYYNPLSWIWAGLTLTGDVVHGQWWAYPLAPVYFLILLLAKLRGKKVIITTHNTAPHEKNRINNFLNNVILGMGDLLIIHSEKNRDDLSKRCGIDSKKIFVVPTGILTPAPVRGIGRKEARRYLKIGNDEKILLFFGNIRDYKGLDVLLKSLKSIGEEITNVRLIVAGQPWENWRKYERIIRENGIGDGVIKKLGFIDNSEVEYYFSASDLVVLPYKYFDSQSGVGAMALPFGKPLVVTDVGGLTDFVKDKRAIAKPNDPEDLARVIVGILKDERLINKLSSDSNELTKKYTWDKIAEETIELYRGLK